MTSRIFDNLGAPNEIEIVSRQKDDTNSQSSSGQRNGTEASEDNTVEIYEGGNTGKSAYTSRQDIAYDDDESQGSQDEEEVEEGDAENDLKPNL
jgi:hypothetical protein